MRFHSAILVLLVTQACALIDAATGDTPAGETSYRKDAIPGTAAKAVAIGQLDMIDSRLDVAVIDSSGTLVLCLQTSAGGWNTRSTSFALYEVVAIADLDGDGFGELIAGGPGKLDVYRSVDGTFELANALPIAVDVTPTRIIAGRLGGSALSSIVIASNKMEVQVFSEVLSTPVLAVLPMSAPSMTGPDGPTARGMAIGDVLSGAAVGDELVVADGSNISAFSGPSLTPQSFAAGGDIMSLTIGEYASGPELDVAVYLPVLINGAATRIFPGSPTSLSNNGVELGLGGGGNELVAGDFNDTDDDDWSDDDLAMLDEHSPHMLRLYVQRATDVFEERSIELDGSPDAIAAGDVNLDGKTDFALAPGSSGGVDLLLSD